MHNGMFVHIQLYMYVYTCVLPVHIITSMHIHHSGEPLEAVTFDQFAHISLGLRTEPTSGILRRQLMMSLIDSRQGDPPHSSDPFYRLIQWLVEVWLLYNSFMLRMDLPELTAGVCMCLVW